ncbi:valine--tRNA ligase [candidate division KSB1 bacterium]
MNTEIPKVYDPKDVEGRIYEFWMENELFKANNESSKKPFTIVLPPPNVTGILHMGHALQNTIQDTIIRFRRMEGYEALWLPGTDHAGIATQNVVEKKLLEEGKTKEDLGRDKFLEEVWKMKEQHGSIIINQMKLLGSSLDWSRLRFTMDEMLSKAVREAFVTLYEQGLVYKGKYIVNWCPRCHTAISDEEVNHIELESNLWYVRYPVKGTKEHITVATTRPETIMGDVAVAMHPDSDLYKKYKDKLVILPITGREAPIIADELVDPKFGTGALKITPSHDPVDFDIGRKHGLEGICVIDDRGFMNDKAGEKYRGLERNEARKRAVEELKEKSLLEKIELYTHSVGHCQRCTTVIEPYLSDQWFVKMKPLAEKSIDAVKKGDIKFVQQRWEKVFFDWMNNIRDWCISRQLWWGHRIPVWYCKSCGEVIVSRDDPAECPKCKSAELEQDSDVLDTWFSSWLWPFSTLGWPEKTKDMQFFYPTSILVSGYDIIFFWIARMIMAGLWFCDKEPYSHVFFTAMIKDKIGRIMSKSLGNGIDPIDMIEQFGADSVRYSLVALSTEGQDIRLSEEKFEMGRNFGNKLWNTFRFLKSNLDKCNNPDIKGETPEYELADKWIISKVNRTIEKVKDCFENYKLNEALMSIYNFIWHDYCDWYLELVKLRLDEKNPVLSCLVLAKIAIPVFEKALKILHPFMPFLTEEIWQRLSIEKRQSIMVAPIDFINEGFIDPDAKYEMELIQDAIYGIRNIRGEMNIMPNKEVPVAIKSDKEEILEIIENNKKYFEKLAKVNKIKTGVDIVKSPQSASSIHKELEIYIPLKGIIDFEFENKRLSKELKRIEGALNGINKKLTNNAFLEKAPEDVIEKERQKSQDYSVKLEKLQQILKSISED